MRAFNLRNELPIILAVAWTIILAPTGVSPRAQRAASSTTEGKSGTPQIFTPAHRTVFDALRDFFNLRPEPVQPVAFTHKAHLASGMHCANCHVGVDTGPEATIPSVKLCMMCHQVIAADHPEIKKLSAYYHRGEDIPWQRVYSYSAEAHVKFKHAPHTRAGIDCATCHGDMSQQTVAVRKVSLTMGYCVNCHIQKKVSIDCTRCHL
jgi:hypothetical protein